MSNVARDMLGKYPTPSLRTGQNLSSESLKALDTSHRQLKGYLASQMVAGNVVGSTTGKRLNKIAQNIILDTDTLNSFFEKLSEFSMSSSMKSSSASVAKATNPKPVSISKPASSLPETRQFMDYGSGGEVQKTIVQNPINRSMDNVGNSQPVFPNKSF